MKKVLLSTLLIFVEGGVHATSYESLVELAGSFDRATADGRRRCYRALRGWYAQNSVWGGLSRREKAENVLYLIEWKVRELEDRGLGFNRRFETGLAACIVKKESGESFYPEIINWEVCENNKSKSFAHGLGQALRSTYNLFLKHPDYLGDRTVTFEEIGTRPDLQIELMLQHINQNLGLNYSYAPLMNQLNIYDDCANHDTPQVEKAIIFYDREKCSEYVKDVTNCQKECFSWNNTTEESINCLAI